MPDSCANVEEEALIAAGHRMPLRGGCTASSLLSVPGIFVTRGSSLRIPAGGLVLPLDGSEPPPVQIELLLELWDRWLEISGTQTLAAEAAHEQLLELISTGDERRGPALEAEFNAALLATATSAFAVDAFYAAVSERVPRHPHAKTWAKNRTPREQQIVEMFKHAFSLTPGHPEQIGTFLRALFTLRGQAVHPPAKYQPASYHTDLHAGVEWRFVQFTAEKARAAFNSTSTLLRRLLEIPRPEHAELQEWIPSAQALLTAAIGESPDNATA